MWNGDFNPELYRKGRFFACNKVLGKKPHLVGCEDEQTVFVGSECFKLIKKADKEGYQPPKGGPRLFLMQYYRYGK